MQHVPKSVRRRPGGSPPATRHHPPGTPAGRRRFAGFLVGVLLSSVLVVAAGPPAGAVDTAPYQRQPLGVNGEQPNDSTSVNGASVDGSKVLLTSGATNLLPGVTSHYRRVYVWNRATGKLISPPPVVNANPNRPIYGKSISADGTKVTFASEATDVLANWPYPELEPERMFLYYWDLTAGTVVSQPLAKNGTSCQPTLRETRGGGMSADGSKVVMTSDDCSLTPGDTNGFPDVYVWTPATGAVQRQPLGVNGAQPNNGAETIDPVISPDGSKVAFETGATNLVAGEPPLPPEQWNVGTYVWNLATGRYERPPLGVDGARPNSYLRPQAISKDNSKVLLTTSASNLVPGDTNGFSDVFIWNRWTGTYERQAPGIDGAQPNGDSDARAISADGNKVLLNSSATNLVAGGTRCGVCIWDRTTGKYTRQARGLGGAEPDGDLSATAMSGDATRVFLSSSATNLVAGDTNGQADAFVWRVDAVSPPPPPPTGYQRQPLGVNGQQPNGLTEVAAASADGSMVVLTSRASNLVPGDNNARNSALWTDVFVWDRRTGTVVRQPPGVDGLESSGNSYADSISADGTKVLFNSNSANLPGGEDNFDEFYDAYVWDLTTGRVEPRPPGAFVNGSCDFGPSPPLGYRPETAGRGISADGNLVLFESDDCSYSPGKVNPYRFELFVWNRATGSVQRQPLGIAGAQTNGSAFYGAFSPDGSKVAMMSTSSNLVKGDTSTAPDLNGLADTYVWNRSTGRYERQPLGVNGAQPNGESTPAAVSKDNSKVLITTYASNLLPGDTNGFADVYIWNRWSVAYQRQPLGVGGAQPNGESSAAAISVDGTKVLLVSKASNLVASDTNGVADVFIWDRSTGKYTRQPAGLAGAQPNGVSGGEFDTAYPIGRMAMTADASTVFLPSKASNLVVGDTNTFQDVFAWTR